MIVYELVTKKSRYVEGGSHEVVFLPDGDLILADTIETHTLIRYKINKTGEPTIVWRSECLNNLSWLMVDVDGLIYALGAETNCTYIVSPEDGAYPQH